MKIIGIGIGIAGFAIAASWIAVAGHPEDSVSLFLIGLVAIAWISIEQNKK